MHVVAGLVVVILVVICFGAWHVWQNRTPKVSTIDGSPTRRAKNLAEFTQCAKESEAYFANNSTTTLTCIPSVKNKEGLILTWPALPPVRGFSGGITLTPWTNLPPDLQHTISQYFPSSPQPDNYLPGATSVLDCGSSTPQDVQVYTSGSNLAAAMSVSEAACAPRIWVKTSSGWQNILNNLNVKCDQMLQYKVPLRLMDTAAGLSDVCQDNNNIDHFVYF
jgi:hypothetical protein